MLWMELTDIWFDIDNRAPVDGIQPDDFQNIWLVSFRKYDMKTRHVHGTSGSSRLLIGEQLKNLPRYLPDKNLAIITDTNVYDLYQKDFPPGHLITIGTGEAIKTLDTVQAIYGQLMDAGMDRSGFILGIGGGIVCDIAGFVASTYLRGVSFGFVATTLLAQVDASVGGKNGVNLGGYKNMVGVFNQPDFVICDIAALVTLPKEEIFGGFAEIIKHAVITDSNQIDYLEANGQQALELDREVMETLIYESIMIKAAVVNRDEKEKGERRKLNFGHTFGHAIQKIAGMPHGQAVAIGMVMAADLSVRKGFLTRQETMRLKRLIEQYGLPTQFEAEPHRLLDAVSKDKKRERGVIHFVLLNGLGHAVVEDIALAELEKMMS